MWNRSRNLAFFWIFALFLVQNSLHFLFSERVPWILLSGVLFYAMAEGPAFGMLIGSYAGFFPDLFGTERIGISMAIFGVLGLLSGFSGAKLFNESPVTQVLLPSLAYYLAAWLNLFIQRVVLQDEAFSFGLFRDAFLPLPLVLTAVSSPLVFFYLKKLTPVNRRRRSAWG